MKSKKSGFKLPHTLVLIYSLVILIYLATLFVPSGEFSRTKVKVGGTERIVTVPGSYKKVEKRVLEPGVLLEAPLEGFKDGALIIVFLFVIGGAFNVIQSTGTVDIAIRRATIFFSTRISLQKYLIPFLMIIFSLAGGIFGMSEEVIPFIPVFIPLAISLGYDSIVGVAIPFLGAAAGFAAAFFNPFTVGIAQGISGLPIYSGLLYRLISWVIGTAVMIIFVMIYANRIRKDPKKSLVYDIDKKRNTGDELKRASSQWTDKNRAISLIFIGGILILVLGVLIRNWYIKPIASVFLAMGIFSGIAGRLSLSDIAGKFIEGAKDMITVAFIIACGRAVLIIATEGRIMDTVLYYTSGAISFFPRILVAQMMFLVQSGINFFIHSGTAQAALTMPVMAPLSDLVGITRQTSVYAFQLCEFVNPILPTSAVTMGILGIAKISWEKWARWFLPLLIILIVISFILLIPPVLFNWGPF